MRAVFWYLVEGGEKVKSREEDSLLCVGRAASGPLSNKIQPDQKRHKKLDSSKLCEFCTKNCIKFWTTSSLFVTTNDELMGNWWITDEVVKWERSDEEVMKKWWRIDEELMKNRWRIGVEVKKNWQRSDAKEA